MTFEEAAAAIRPGRYRHFKGNEYEVLAIARHSETTEPMVVYRAHYGEGGIWVRPAAMWDETVERGGKTFRRFEKMREDDNKKPSLLEEGGAASGLTKNSDQAV